MLVSRGVAGGWWRRGGEDQQRGGTVAAASSYSGASGRCPRHCSHHRTAARRPATPSLPLVRTRRTTYRGHGAQLCTKKQLLNELIFTSH